MIKILIIIALWLISGFAGFLNFLLTKKIFKNYFKEYYNYKEEKKENKVAFISLTLGGVFALACSVMFFFMILIGYIADISYDS